MDFFTFCVNFTPTLQYHSDADFFCLTGLTEIDKDSWKVAESKHECSVSCRR